MRLYGTVTSPFVRRVRVVLAELGLPFELQETASEEGQRALARLTPLRKVPALEVDGRVIFDSRGICDFLFSRHGSGPLRVAADDAEDSNLRYVVDGALESAIRLFYFKRDGMNPEGAPYLMKEQRRVAETMAWIAERLSPGSPAARADFGITVINVVSMLDWMRFRGMFPVEEHPSFVTYSQRWAERPSLRATLPGG